MKGLPLLFLLFTFMYVKSQPFQLEKKQGFKYVNHTTYSNEKLAKVLADCNCPLIKQKGVEGLQQVYQNLFRDEHGSLTEYYTAADVKISANSGADNSAKYSGELNDIFTDSAFLKELNRHLLKACFSKEQHKKFETKSTNPRSVMVKIAPLAANMTLVFASRTICMDISELEVPSGSLYLALFKQKLWKLIDYFFMEIEKSFGPLELNNIVPHKEERRSLQEILCFELTMPDTTQEDEERIRFYQKKFFGTTICD
ncbi:hypothetical protein [Flagellimonas sp. CMM7]|uniref:hypothetical protein n=1 Tax=Flagellimonas sp. CMM7 TaxID=2654676 RepID=UPI0013D02AE5|nr:hypothetical protein [Flagellimonas sp. CMM7]UII81509.1 hypothetical protein LV704_08310 [Flagellimonas sp. CMM7]